MPRGLKGERRAPLAPRSGRRARAPSCALKIQAITSRRRCHVVESLMRVRRVSQLKSCGGDDFMPRRHELSLNLGDGRGQAAAG
jgi:hypothetical protein